MIPTKVDVYAQKHYFNETSFTVLMKKRIYRVLLISSVYDAFMIEEDGRIDEQIFYEYMSLNLRYPPEFIMANSEEEAFSRLEDENIDLVVSMLSAEEADTFELANKIKHNYPEIPIVVLTPFSREVRMKLEDHNYGAIDYIFSWLGNADILMAIIKLIEDSMNVEHDVEEVGVQTIILVEDNIRFYSSYLPNIYKIIFKQSKSFMTEGLNEHQKMLRMRGRPKILLATNYEDALDFYEKYKDNLLGVISDITYPHKGVIDKEAGIKLFRHIKKYDKLTPLLLQSSQPDMKAKVKPLKVGFIDKNSKSLGYELREFIKEYFAFGDFIFKDPGKGWEVGRAKNLRDLQEKIFQIPLESLQYHIERNHFSKWLRARALFPIAELFKAFVPDDFSNSNEIRNFIFETIANFRMTKARGVISTFNRDTFDEYFTISRIGEGSLGGKARGLAFLDSLIKRNLLYHRYDNINIAIPKTVVLGTDIFDEFMEVNNLYPIALQDEASDDEILEQFLAASLPDSVRDDLYTIISLTEKPLAVRSSSLLEDSHYQPFAGIYNTYMIPFVDDYDQMFELLSTAIKGVYASAFYTDSKAYMEATSNVIDEEKMAIVLQTVCGSKYDNRYYPTFSGVARSIDYYPIPPAKSEDGTASIAFGLGKHVVDGGLSLRFSPKYPKNVLQTSNPDMALKETQKVFYALDLDPSHFTATPNDSKNLLKMRIKEAEKDNSLKPIASTYDFHNHTVRDAYNYAGKKIVTFSSILKHNTFPLAEILESVLKLGEQEMGKPVEIEFVVDLNVGEGEATTFHLLQIRPIASRTESVNIEEMKLLKEDAVIISKAALGNGIVKDIQDVVYVRPEHFDAAKNEETVDMVGKLNDQFIERNENYILIGPGRWGSSDPWLGIPVKWPHISAARLIIESGLENYRIDPSQGTHFFQNLTSFRVGYFTINPFIDDGFYNLDYLDQMPAVFENETIRHIRFEKPLNILIDGKKNLGVVLKPEVSEEKVMH